MLIKKSTLLFINLAFIINGFLALVVANRNIEAVEDNWIYKENFYNISFGNFRYEYIFDLITFLIHSFTNDYIIYFFILNSILNIFLIISLLKIARFYEYKAVNLLIVFFGFILTSSWYLVSSSNGLRQGLALALLYIAILDLMFFNKKKTAIATYLASCLFHYSNLLLFPFIFLTKLKTKTLLIISIISAVFYFLNINEGLIKLISDTLNLPLYKNIKYYTEDVFSYRYGFQPDLYIYTISLGLLYYTVNKFFLKNKLDNLVNIYLILSIFYYTFGFAGFSNRYGLPSWFFSLFLNTLITYTILRKHKKLFLMFVFIFIFIASLKFIYFFGYL